MICNNSLAPLLVGVLTVVLAVSCVNGNKPVEELPESREAKQLMQGLWAERESGDLFFRMEGDTVYYPDSLVQPAAFRVVGDTLYIGGQLGYHIEKQSEHVLWFKNQNGEVVKLEKTAADQQCDGEIDIDQHQAMPDLREVIKRDTVVMLDGQRYHCYIAINPTHYKIVRTSINEDGMQVERVYYDNIVHISIFRGDAQLFSRDFRKQQYHRHVPQEFLGQAKLNDMEFAGCDGRGFHFIASLCYPDAASCYMVENVIDRSGQLTTKLFEY